MILLGDQLIRDAGLAVFELVKNAYDADATLCAVSLHNVHQPAGGQIVVLDNGTGMTRDTVIDAWMSPGTRNRLTEREEMLGKKRTASGRLPLGEKGVGRFAVHKLGDRIEMVTRAAGEKEVVVSIDWKKFNSDAPLEKILVGVQTREPEVFKKNSTGTQIVVSELREGPWTRARVRSLHRAVTSICSPIDGPSRFKAAIGLSPDSEGWLDGLLTASEVRELALFRFKGTIDERGLEYQYEFTPPEHMRGVSRRKKHAKRAPIPKPERSKSDMLLPLFGEGESDESDFSTKWKRAKIGSVTVSFDIFDLDRKTLAALESDPIGLKDFLKNNGGVRVYRDGVRVYDFGEPGNDWLDLGGRRVNVPTKRIGNNQVLGEVHLALKESQGLIEKTNREGFVENDAYSLLRYAVSYAIEQAQAERNIDKSLIRASDKADKKKEHEPVLDDLSNLREEVSTLAIPDSVSERLVSYINRIDVEYREVMERLLTAAASGLNLTLVIHEVEKGIETLYGSLRRGMPAERVLAQAKELADQVNSISWILRQSGSATVRAATFIEQVQFAWQFRFQSHSIDVVNGIETGSPDFAVKCNRRLIMSALMNLVDNAIYWSSQHNGTAGGKLWIGTSMDLGSGPALVVADNGPGFHDPPEYLTAAFFTRKPDGMGLGLHLAAEIMKQQGGRLLFPSRSDAGVPRGFDGAIAALLFRSHS